jgi:Holliday junction DNA helicase RuvA
LEKALENEDISRLEAVPGLGKKTAQKMILALKGRLVHPAAAIQTPHGELAEALAGMGYDRKAAAEALGRADASLDRGLSGAEREQRLFKQAILYLSGMGEG